MINSCSYPFSSRKQWMALILGWKALGGWGLWGIDGNEGSTSAGRCPIVQTEHHRPPTPRPPSPLWLCGLPLVCFLLWFLLAFSSTRQKKKKKKICLLPRAQRSWKSQFHSAQIGGVSLIMERPRIPGPASSEWCEPAKQTQLSTADASGTEAGGGGTWVPSGISHQPSHRPHSGQSWPLGLQNLKKKNF